MSEQIFLTSGPGTMAIAVRAQPQSGSKNFMNLWFLLVRRSQKVQRSFSVLVDRVMMELDLVCQSLNSSGYSEAKSREAWLV